MRGWSREDRTQAAAAGKNRAHGSREGRMQAASPGKIEEPCAVGRSREGAAAAGEESCLLRRPSPPGGAVRRPLPPPPGKKRTQDAGWGIKAEGGSDGLTGDLFV